MAEFFDSQGNAAFYAYGDYNNSGKPLSGMYGGRLFQRGQRLRHQRGEFDLAAAAIRPHFSTRRATPRSMP